MSSSELIGGRYRIEREVARGGMATVYLAIDTRLERKVALKIIHPHLAKDTSFREKFIREARIAAKLSHPNLVNVFDQGEEGELAFMVMELVEGITLRDALKDFGPIDAARALELFEAMLSGLAAAHRAGILHRDLKPENVLLADDGRIKLGDFGLARDIDNHTSTGSLVGTVAYLSPELVMRGTADARSDVYAAGIMLFEILTGKQPFQGEQAVQIAYQHANDSVPAPSSVNRSVPPLLDEIVLWATAKEPAHRPSDAMELLSVVQRARADLKAGRANATIQIPQAAHNDATQLLSQSDLAATTVLSTESIAATQLLNSNLNSTEVFDGFEFQDATDSALANLGRKKRGARLLIATALVILLGAGAGWWFGSGPGGLSMIPNLTSRSVTDAQVALEALKGNVEILEESSATVAKGLVIRTEPAAGSFYFGGTIKLFVSSGPKLVAAPDLIGMNVAEATAELIKNGFLLGQVNSWFNEAELGAVYSYLGSDGAEIPEGSRIDLSVSLGQIPVVAGLEQEAAVTLIEAAGLTIDKVTEDYSDTIAAGQVISMVPQSEPLGQGGLVNLVVSKGPNIVTVPNMVGETVLAAKTALQNLGLVVIVNTNQLQNKWGVVPVKRQSAAAGTQLRVGDSITIFTK
ncbi:MAG: hypothetical protein RL100_38 [Actinomycetota bacterium]|jgi:serine/threonine-protein kinase